MADATGEAGKLVVFISYSRDDLAFADQLDATLRIGGFSTTLDRHGIHAGEQWEPRLGALIRNADTVVFVLTPNSARSKICAWEVEEARRLGKRIMPVVPGPLGDAQAPPGLAALNYIFFYDEPKKPGSSFGAGLLDLVEGLKTDLDWLREHTRLLQRATEWDTGGRPANRLLSGGDIAAAKDWAARRPKDAPAPTALHLDFVKASEAEEARRASAERLQIKEMAAAQDARAKALAEAEYALNLAAVAQRRRAFLRNALLIVMALAAAFSGWSWYTITHGNKQLAEQVQHARAAATRAKAAESQAQISQRRAQEAEFRAIINECEASEQLLRANPGVKENLSNYLSCGVRLGFALIREKRAADSIVLFQQLIDVARKPGRTDYSIDPFYLLVASQGLAVAQCADTEPKSAARRGALEHLVIAADAIAEFSPPSELTRRWREELFRGLLYLSNLSNENGDNELAYQYSSKLSKRLSALQIDGVDTARALVRALDHLTWMALLTKRNAHALAASDEALRTADEFGVKDINLRLNRAHAVLFNGRIEEARKEYQQLNPEDVATDAEKLLSAGLCHPFFATLLEAAKECADSLQLNGAEIRRPK